jgi:hypothetical protein
MLPAQNAERIVGLHRKSIICSGEVLGQFLDSIGPENVDEYMKSLDAELLLRFELNLRTSSNPETPQEMVEKWAKAEKLVANWISTNESTPTPYHHDIQGSEQVSGGNGGQRP